MGETNLEVACDAGAAIGAGQFLLVERESFIGMREKLHELPLCERGTFPALSQVTTGIVAQTPGHLRSWSQFYMSQFYVSDCAGRGANGEVWRGVTTSDNKPVRVVLKRIYTGRGPNAVASSMREVFFGEFLGSKRSNLSRFITHFVENGELWLVFRDEGISLYQAIFEPVQVGESMMMTQSLFWREIRHNPLMILAIIKQVLYGLREIHSLEISHRDVKMENVFIDPVSLHVRIGDFGSATQKGFSSHFFPNGGPSLDEETQRYAPPEEWSIERAPSLDMWCVGIMWLEIFLGSVDLGLDDSRGGICVRDEKCEKEQLRSRILLRDPIGKGVDSEDMLDLIHQLLSFDPKKRPSAEDALKHRVFAASSVAIQVWSKPDPNKLSLVVDTALSQGGRSNMEDRLVTGWLGSKFQNFIACVFDGHNGADISALLSATLEEYIAHSSDERASNETLKTIIDFILRKVGKEEARFDGMTGSTLCCALVNAEGVWAANIGDSRLIVVEAVDEPHWKPELGGRVTTASGVTGKVKEFRNGIPLLECEITGRLSVGKNVHAAGKMVKSFQVTMDHKPDVVGEKKFIEENGGYVSITGCTARVNGILAISRSVGVRSLRPVLRSDPDYTFFPFPTPTSKVQIVLGTDGVWDVLAVQEVAELETAQSIVERAIASGARDNIAVIRLNVFPTLNEV